MLEACRRDFPGASASGACAVCTVTGTVDSVRMGAEGFATPTVEV